MTDTYATQKLVILEIATGSKVWNRCILTRGEAPSTDDLLFYYKTLLGFADAELTVRFEDVPLQFNTTLLAMTDEAPSVFPAHDLETAPEEEEKRKKYTGYIAQICEMERSRAALGFFIQAGSGTAKLPAAGAFTKAVSEEPLHVKSQPVNHRKKWVTELLKTMNADAEFEEDALVPHPTESERRDDITEESRLRLVPHAWIVTPTVGSARRLYGSRFIVDQTLGQKWERLLGTDVYPDVLISRRITSAAWAFQHATSEALVKSMLDWYLASQDAQFEYAGVTAWIPEADTEIANLFGTLRRIKVNEKFLKDCPGQNDYVTQVYKLLSNVESQLLGSSASDEEVTIHAIGPDAFRRYMTYMFKHFGIPREVFDSLDGYGQILTRWVHSGLGFRPDVDPLVSAWKETWNYSMRGSPTPQRVNHFLATLDSWDTLEITAYGSHERAAIAQEWIRIYLDTQLEYDIHAKVKSILLHDQIKLFSYKYIPQNIFKAQFTPMLLGPVLTKRGFSSVKEKDGRYIHGIRFKKMLVDESTPSSATESCTMSAAGGAGASASSGPVEVDFSAGFEDADRVEANTIHFSKITKTEGDAVKTEQKTFVQSVKAESGTLRIEHYFAGAQEIHLGTL